MANLIQSPKVTASQFFNPAFCPTLRKVLSDILKQSEQ